MFIELTDFHNGSKSLLNLDKVTEIVPEMHNKTVFTNFMNSEGEAIYIAKESYEEVKRLIMKSK